MMVVNNEDDCDSFPSKCTKSMVKSKTYYGGEVFTCLSTLLNSKKIVSDSSTIDNERFEFIGAEVKLRKSSLSNEETRRGSFSEGTEGKRLNVNFFQTVVVKEYPSFDFLLAEYDESCSEYEKTTTIMLEESIHDKENNREEEKENTISNVPLNLSQVRQQESSLEEIKATNTVNKLINKYKEMIDSRVMLNGFNKKSIFFKQYSIFP